MATNPQMTFAERFREGLEQAQARLTDIEDEAQRMLRGVLDRGKLSSREMANLLARLNSGELLDKNTVKEWQGRARHVSADLVKRLEGLRARAVAYAGVASREQVGELAKEVDRLSRKLDRLVGAKKSTARAEREDKH